MSNLIVSGCSHRESLKLENSITREGCAMSYMMDPAGKAHLFQCAAAVGECSSPVLNEQAAG